jgi:hypothetical protein
MNFAVKIVSLTQELGTEQFIKNLASTPKSPLPVEIPSSWVLVNSVRGVDMQFEWRKLLQFLKYKHSHTKPADLPFH